jgi:hypothetical protein
MRQIRDAKRLINDRIVELTGSGPRFMLEVGSFSGSSAVIGWAHLVDPVQDGLLLCIDTWEGAGLLPSESVSPPPSSLSHPPSRRG